MSQAVASEEVKRWNAELGYARKREKEFRKEGVRLNKIYEAEKKEEFQFNILYSNTETLQPALYNNVPRPVVNRRFKDKDPTGKVASKVTQRVLEYLIDSNDQDYSNFDDMMKSAVVEALVPGRGLTRFKYEPTYGDEIPKAEGAPADEPAERKVDAETVCGEEVPWNRVLMGYAKKWKDVPWIAFEHFMNKDEVADNFGTAVAATMQYPVTGGSEGGDAEDGENTEKIKEAEGEKLAHVYEIWNKRTKEVIFVAEGHDTVLKKVADPLQLSGFYPCPRPMSFLTKISTLTPTALYAMYEEQARELNTCTIRINKIMRAMKVRGFYDSTLGGLSELMEAEDNTLKPAENVAAMLQGQTLDKAIWFFPVEKLVGVLQQLYTQREQCKAVIYEITGISDILRGSSVASETATAQNIKNQWGTLRLKKMQKEVMRYVRDSLRIMAEIAVTKLSQETIAAMTGMELPTAQQKQMAQAAIMKAQQAAAMSAQQPSMPGQPPVPPPEPPPEALAAMQLPSWEEVMGLLADDIQRDYRIDIETNSTVDAEATEDKADVSEFMNAMAQFMNGMMPVIEQGVMSFDVAKGMLMAIVRRFRFGTEVEDQIMEMKAPPPKQPGEDPKAMADKAKADAEMKALESQTAYNEKKMQSELALGQQQAELDSKRIASELALGQQQAELAAEKLQQQRTLAALEHEIKLEELELKREELAARKAALAQQKSETSKGESNATV